MSRDRTTPSSQPTSSPRSGPTCACAGAARASFLLESVEHGRLGRYSLVGCGLADRRPRRGGSAAASRSSATSPTTTSRSSSRRCRCRTPGRAFPRPASSSRTSSSASTTSRGAGRGAAAETPPRSSRCSTAHSARSRTATAPSSGPLAPYSRPARVRAHRRRREGAHPRRRRVPDRALAARRAADVRRRDRSSTARFAASTRRRTSSSWSSATTSRWSAPRPRRSSSSRADARASTRSRGRRCAGRATRSVCSRSEKDRAEHVMLVDLGRNDLSRVCVPGTVRVERFMEAERFSHVTHLVSEVAGELREGVSHFDLLRACFPGRHGLRRAEGARDADHLRARGLPARPVRRRGRLRASRAARSTRASRSARSCCTRRRVPAGGRRDRRRLRPAGRAAGVPEQARGARDGDRAGGGAAQ